MSRKKAIHSLFFVCFLFYYLTAMSSYKHLTLTQEHAICTITLAREKQLNALHTALLAELEAVFLDIEYSLDLKGVILHGAGEKAFAAGADISEFVGKDEAAAKEMSVRGQALFSRIERSRLPVVAAIGGYALGGGCELAMACHLRIATLASRFGQPELRLGLIPGYGGTQRLVRLIGQGRAMEWILGAETYSAEQALQAGLLSEVVEAEEALLPRARHWIENISKGSPEAIAAAIGCMLHAGAPDGYAREARAFGHCSQTANAQEGIAAFLEKRAPRFKRGDQELDREG